MPLKKILALLLGLALLPAGVPAQSTPRPTVTITQASPETPEQFAARKLALQEMLQRLTTTGRIMQVVAHPDDEDGAMLTLESRVKGNTAMLFTFTRGEGGQNAQGAVFFDELGILRTLELLAADKEYGAEERFSHVADFGFSKSADESFRKWGGEDVPEGDLVRAIREFQPDVLVARFSGTPKDGHGHHQASALMTIKAFHDAADPQKFPKAGKPWQASKLYTGLAGDDATLVPDENQPSPLLDGKTPVEVAVDGLRFQKSQGLGNLERHGPLPKRFSSYKLVETANGVPKAAHEKDFFDGIDTSLSGLMHRYGQNDLQAEKYQPDFLKIAELARETRAAAAKSPDVPLSLLATQQALTQLVGHEAFGNTKSAALHARFSDIERQFEEAFRLAAGITASLERTDSEDKFAAPGETLPLRYTITNHGSQQVALFLSEVCTGPHCGPESLKPGETRTMNFALTVPLDAKATRAPFHRDSPVTDAVYQLDDPAAADPNALPQLPISRVFNLDGKASVRVTAPIFIAPPYSVTNKPTQLLRRLNQSHEAKVEVNIQNTVDKISAGKIKLSLPRSWTSGPAEVSLVVPANQAASSMFTLHWPTQVAQSKVESTFLYHGDRYSENYHLVSRADLPDAFPYYAPAQTSISLIDADIPEQHNIGYIMGAGDTLPGDLTSLGFTVHLLTAEDLATGDLKQYDTIVTGVRAYGSRADLRQHNSRLLDYVKNGGTLVVQYEQDFNAFNQGHYTPFPAVMGRDRVSQEEQPVKILDPESSILRYPNRITSADFDNWVQERGLYFMKEWAPEYTPLLSMNDVGEPPLEGGLLVAHYGKGTYIYTGLSFYRELPNGVPGAARLFINLLAAGHDPAEQPVTNARK